MSRTNITIAILALFTGGLGGSVFTWYINRPKPTVLTYNIVTTTTGADATTKGLVPNLKLRIGDEDVPVIYTHTIDLTVQSGPQVESAQVEVPFPTGFRLFGSDFHAPTGFHHMNCNPASYGVQCDVGPLAPGKHNKFRISLATNQAHPDEIFTTTNKVELAKLDDYIGSDEKWYDKWSSPLIILFGFFGFTTLISRFLLNRLIKEHHGEQNKKGGS